MLRLLLFLIDLKSTILNFRSRKYFDQTVFSQGSIKELTKIGFQGQQFCSANFFRAKKSDLSLFDIQNVCPIFPDIRESKDEKSGS